MINNPNIPTPPLPGPTPPVGDPPGPTPPPSPSPGPTPPGRHSTDHWTDDDRMYIKGLRNENEESRKKVKALEEAIQAIERAKQEAEEAKQREQGQFKELATNYKTKIEQLEPLAAQLEALSKLEHDRIDALVKDWPEKVKPLVPGRDKNVVERLAQVETLQPLVADLITQQQGRQPGNPPAPRPAGLADPKEGVAELQRRYQETRGNIF